MKRAASCKRSVLRINGGKGHAHYAVRLVCKGQKYGLHEALTHDKDDPLVEFYDARYRKKGFTRYGQFVSRYNRKTLCRKDTYGMETAGLDLQGDVPSWKVSPEAMKRVYRWLGCE
jgi:hypothetical protein